MYLFLVFLFPWLIALEIKFKKFQHCKLTSTVAKSCTHSKECLTVMQSFKMQIKVATSFQSNINELFFTNYSALSPHRKSNIDSVTDTTLQATMSLRLNGSNCNRQAVLKIHCIDLADSRDPLVPSPHCSFRICSISHNIEFGRIL